MEEIDIIPNGREKSVTLENRNEYVSAYVDYYMNKVIEAQYEAFAHVSQSVFLSWFYCNCVQHKFNTVDQ